MTIRVCSPAITIASVCVLAFAASAGAQTVRFDPAKVAYFAGAAPNNLTVGEPADLGLAGDDTSPGGGGGGGDTGNATWMRPVNVTVTGSSVQKTSGCDGCFDASAVSAQGFSGDGAGFMEFTVTDPNPLLVAGLAFAFSGNPASIDFGVRVQSGYAEVRENGIYRTDIRIQAGDVIRIAVAADRVSYAVNGNVFYVSTHTPPPDELHAAVAIASVGGSIDNVTIGSGG